MRPLTIFTTVTPFSKKIALFLFIFLPILAFIFGMKYEDLLIIKKGFVIKKDLVNIPTPSIIKKADDLHIWKTYKSDVGKLSFEYPSSWKIEKSTIGEDRLFLKSPDGFEFRFGVSGMQGGPTRCTTNQCPIIENYSIKPIKVSTNKTIYLVHGRFDSNIPENSSISKDMNIYASDNPYPNYAIEAGAGIWYDLYMKNNLTNQWNKSLPLYIFFYGEYPSGSYQQNLSAFLTSFNLIERGISEWLKKL